MCDILVQKTKRIISEKNTNVILSADLEEDYKILNLVDELGPLLLGVKLHSDIIKFSNHFDFYEKLKELKEKHNLIVIDDRKFCDIGNTVKLQSEEICKYADLITVHAISGHGILDGLRNNCESYNCGILLIAEMSSNDNLIDRNYTNRVVDMARSYDDIVVGFICQSRLDDSGDFLHFTPGVKYSDPLCGNQDNLGQRYKSPEYLIEQQKVDVLIVGRGIYQSDDPSLETKKYIYTRKNAIIKEICNPSLEIVKHGEFVLKSGKVSNTYVDLRMLMNYPQIMRDVCKAMLLNLPPKDCTYNVIGVPMGALPITTIFSLVSNIPMIMMRDKPKQYGCKNLIEGQICYDKKCIVIEDVVTTGGSLLSFIKRLEEQGLEVSKVLCILDREQGGMENIRKEGYEIESLLKLSDIQ